MSEGRVAPSRISDFLGTTLGARDRIVKDRIHCLAVVRSTGGEARHRFDAGGDEDVTFAALIA